MTTAEPGDVTEPTSTGSSIASTSASTSASMTASAGDVSDASHTSGKRAERKACRGGGRLRRALPRRVIAVGAVASVVAAMLIVDGNVRRTRPERAVPLSLAGPVATPEDGGSSSWLCLGTGEPESVVVLTNPGQQDATGTVRYLGPNGSISTEDVTVPAGGRTQLDVPEVTVPSRSNASEGGAASPTATTRLTAAATVATVPERGVAPTIPNSVARASSSASTVPPGNAASSSALSSALSSAQSSASPDTSDGQTVAAVAAVIELSQGGVVADHRLIAGSGAVAPCSASASTQWFIPDGATTLDATTTLVLANPFPDDSIVDLRFQTDQGPASPSALQGVIVPAGSVRGIDVGSYVRRRTRVSATAVARTGRIVAEGVLRFDGSDSILGATIVQGAPASGSAWYFPSGRSDSDLVEHYVIQNPGDVAVTVEITVLVAGRESEPFEVEVEGRSVEVFEPADETRVPAGVDYSLIASTPSNRGIVVSRRLEANARTRRGVASTLGGRILANRWTIADAEATRAVDDRIAILSPSDLSTSVTVYRIDGNRSTSGGASGGSDAWNAIDGLSDLRLDAGDRLDIRIGDFVALDGDSLVIVADGGPVFVDRSRVRVQAPGNRPARPDLRTFGGRVGDFVDPTATGADATEPVGPDPAATDVGTTEAGSTEAASTEASPEKPQPTVALARVGKAAVGTSTALAIPSAD